MKKEKTQDTLFTLHSIIFHKNQFNDVVHTTKEALLEFAALNKIPKGTITSWVRGSLVPGETVSKNLYEFSSKEIAVKFLDIVASSMKLCEKKEELQQHLYSTKGWTRTLEE